MRLAPIPIIWQERMADVIELKKGGIYFRAVFYDRDLSIPSIESYVYEGFDQEHGHLFIDAAGHVARENGAENPTAHYVSFEKDTEMCILDKEHLIKWLQEEHSPRRPGRDYKYVAI